jgi:branched-chain amino acid transport system permease protein
VLLLFLMLGITWGGIYALIGLGFNTTFWTLKILNFAQGEYLMAAVLLSIGFNRWLHLPFLLAVLLALVAVALLGVLLERVAIRPVLRQDPSSHAWVVTTLGAGIVLQNLAVILFGTSEYAFPKLVDGTLSLGVARVEMQLVATFVVTVALVLVFDFFVNRTLIGKAIKAVAFDRKAAEAQGINSRAIVALSMVLMAVLAGVAGVLVAPMISAHPYMGTLIGLKGFAAAVLGGMGSPMGAIVGGLVVGVSEQLVGGLVNPGLKDSIGLVILFLILVFRPQGIFGKKIIEKV